MLKARSALALVGVLAFAGTAYAMAPPFNELDKNRYGKLSKAECASVKGLDFAKADTNKDGYLDRAEYEAAMG